MKSKLLMALWVAILTAALLVASALAHPGPRAGSMQHPFGGPTRSAWIAVE